MAFDRRRLIPAWGPQGPLRWPLLVALLAASSLTLGLTAYAGASEGRQIGAVILWGLVYGSLTAWEAGRRPEPTRVRWQAGAWRATGAAFTAGVLVGLPFLVLAFAFPPAFWPVSFVGLVLGGEAVERADQAVRRRTRGRS